MDWLRKVYSRLRNVDRLENAQRQMRIAVGMACQAQEQAAAAQLQLTACRAILATAMRDRDHYEAAVEVLARELAQLKQERRCEKEALRFWLTRTVRPQKGSEN